MAKKRGTKLVGKAIAAICMVAVVTFGLAGWAWWRQIYNDPQRAFWSMLSTSLSTSSVTRRITQNDQAGSLDQITRLHLGGQSLAEAQTVVKQPLQSGLTTVTTETIGTPGYDYARYTGIDTKERGRNGKPLDPGSILNIWSKNDDAPAGQPTNVQFLNGTILSIVPFAPLGSSQRQKVLQTMRDNKVYDIDYSKVTSRADNGRQVFIYAVKVNPGAYVTMLKTLAHEMGLTQLDKVDPAAYANNASEQIEIAVDKLSHQLVRLSYSSGARQEAYSGYGLQATVDIPSASIPVSQLQARLQAL